MGEVQRQNQSQQKNRSRTWAAKSHGLAGRGRRGGAGCGPPASHRRRADAAGRRLVRLPRIHIHHFILTCETSAIWTSVFRCRAKASLLKADPGLEFRILLFPRRATRYNLYSYSSLIAHCAYRSAPCFSNSPIPRYHSMSVHRGLPCFFFLYCIVLHEMGIWRFPNLLLLQTMPCD